MRFTPHDYQRRAIAHVEQHPYCGLFLDMGLGKSVITLTAISRLIDYGEVSSVLVVAPKTVAESTWGAEVAKWDHLRHLKVSLVMGTPEQREASLEEDADIHVTTRDLFVKVVAHYKGRLWPFDMVVIDELTSFKTPRSLRFKAFRKVRPQMRRVVGLTGTPAPNGMLDLWAQMYCIDEGKRLCRFVTHYRQTYFSEIRVHNIPIKTTLLPGMEDVIRGKISDICLTMQARDYLTLPPLMVTDVAVRLPAAKLKAYRHFERDKVLEFARNTEGKDRNVVADSAAALMNKLAQFANGAVYDDDGSPVEIHQSKVEALVELVEGAQSPVLVFYQFRHDIPRITEAMKGLRVETYKGADTLEAWNSGKIDVLLAHPSSTAYGLNMQQGGHYIVWFGTGWNLELYQQANARLHRQGQEHPVIVYRLLTEGTVDARMAAALESKRSMQQGMLDALGEMIKEYEQ